MLFDTIQILKKVTGNAALNAGRSNLVIHYSSPATLLKMVDILNAKIVKMVKGKVRNKYG